MNSTLRFPRYIPIPVSLMKMDLTDTALIVYGFLLSRYSLSHLNNFTDENGRVYILYTQEDLAKDIGKTSRTVMRAMKELEKHGLIRTKRKGHYAANMIYVTIPSDPDDKTVTIPDDRNVTRNPAQMSPETRQDCHTSISKSINKSNIPSQYSSPSPTYSSPNNGRGGGRGGRTDSGMFAPIPDYENCEWYGL